MVSPWSPHLKKGNGAPDMATSVVWPNSAAAKMHEVRTLGCFNKGNNGDVVRERLQRIWQCCESV